MAGRGGRGGGRGGKLSAAADLARQTAMEVGSFPAYFSAVNSEKPGALFPPVPLRKFVFPSWRGRVSDTNLIDTAAELSAHKSPFNLDEPEFCRASAASLPSGASLAERHARLQAETNRRLLAHLAPVLRSDLFPRDLVNTKSAGFKRGRDAAAARRREAIAAVEAVVDESRAAAAAGGLEGAGAEGEEGDEEGAADGGMIARRLGGEDEEVYEAEGEGDEDEDEDDVVVDEDDDYVLASLLGEDDFEDDVLLEDEDVEAEAEADGAAGGSGLPVAGDDAFDDDELADLFGSVGMSRDGAVEASGMSPGDAG